MRVYTEQILDRLSQLKDEIVEAHRTTYYERLWAFADYCQNTPSLNIRLTTLPRSSYSMDTGSLYPKDHWPVGEASYAYRWDAIVYALKSYDKGSDLIQMQAPSKSAFLENSYAEFTKIFIIPLYNYLVDDIKTSSNMLHLLLRYKRWAEWFEANHLRQIYEADSKKGEDVLDENLRCFLFESGIDYPFSQPASPRGKVDVVAGLDTDDPLVLEIKVWHSEKGYKEDRICDGLRQVMEYATKYGKDKGHVAVFNLDQEPLSFVSQQNKSEWPPRIEYGGRTYFFIDIHIAEKLKPISQQDKGKPVRVNEIDLTSLLDTALG